MAIALPFLVQRRLASVDPHQHVGCSMKPRSAGRGKSGGVRVIYFNRLANQRRNLVVAGLREVRT